MINIFQLINMDKMSNRDDYFPAFAFYQNYRNLRKKSTYFLTAGRSYDRNPSSKMISILKRMFQTVAAIAFYQNYQTLEKFYI